LRRFVPARRSMQRLRVSLESSLPLS